MSNILTFSPAMLKTFEQSPQEFYAKYIEGVAAPQSRKGGESGKRIHALASYYLRGFEIERMKTALSAEEKALWEKLSACEYFKMQPLKTEFSLNCKVGGYWISGRLDALVRSGDDFYILDYKTGAIPKEPEKDLQTMVYLLCADKYLKRDYNKLSFVYIGLKHGSEIKIEFTQPLKTKFEDALTTILNKIRVL